MFPRPSSAGFTRIQSSTSLKTQATCAKLHSPLHHALSPLDLPRHIDGVEAPPEAEQRPRDEEDPSLRAPPLTPGNPFGGHHGRPPPPALGLPGIRHQRLYRGILPVHRSTVLVHRTEVGVMDNAVEARQHLFWGVNHLLFIQASAAGRLFSVFAAVMNLCL